MLQKKSHIAFNNAFITGKETNHINEAIKKRKISGNGYYSKLCHKYFNAHLNNQVNLCRHPVQMHRNDSNTCRSET